MPPPALIGMHCVYNVHIFLHRFKNIDLPYRGYYQVRVVVGLVTVTLGTGALLRVDGARRDGRAAERGVRRR